MKKLLEGEIYVVQNGQLQLIVRDNDLPKVPVSREARDALHDLRRRCRRELGGFRPDLALVASAMIEYATALPHAESLVKAYAQAALARKAEPQVLAPPTPPSMLSSPPDDPNIGQTARYP